MIIGQDLVVHLVLKNNFKQQVLSWNDDVVPIKNTGSLLGRTNLTK